MLKSDQKFGMEKYCLARVTATHPDRHSRVRTVTVTVRDLRKARGERNNQLKPANVEMEVGVQRLVVLLPVGEHWKHGLMAPEAMEKQQESNTTNL